jgi:hypothetical protein
MKQAKLAIMLSVLLALSANCTGVSIAATGGVTADTNPAQEYGRLYSTIYKYGAIFHMRTVAGQIGNGTAELTGKACSHSVLYLVGFGDSSIAAAKAQGGIGKIAGVDHQVMGILSAVYHRHCTIVYGSK